ncbi:Serine dehydratase-like protein [Heterocephalus glaber]|uniref:Serine dehydratase-like protein n=1 Tax=Heterocephalus glaber TaxID=10181 RepID=G5AKX2_HETGA|nr:Serine dehydratase-like protein [Heterocephalus glaber]
MNVGMDEWMDTLIDGYTDGWLEEWIDGKMKDDERMLVEPACGAALAAIYSGLLGQLQAEGRLSPSLASVVVIVCGGNNIDSRQLQSLQTQLGQT